LQNLFDNWLVSVKTEVENSISGGCDPQIANNADTLTLPSACDGGIVTVVWTITDICDTLTFNNTFTVEPPLPVAFDQPADTTLQACDLDSQADLQNLFDNWLVSVRTEVENSISGGCDPQIANNADTLTLPSACDGGILTVVWTITDICDTLTFNNTFTVEPPLPVAFDQPADTTLQACDLDSQADLQNLFDNWLVSVRAEVENSISSGCDPQITNNADTLTLPSACDGGIVTVVWTITDICDTLTFNNTFSVEPPLPVAFDQPADTTLQACDLDSQADLQNLFDNWLVSVRTEVENSISGGCDPQIANNADTLTLPSACDGGIVTVVWTITDICDTLTFNNTFSVEPPLPVAFDQPADTTLQACDLDSQADLQNLFDNWLVSVRTEVENSISGGCDPQIANNADTLTLPSACDGGILTVLWTITDICDTITVSAQFSVTPPSSVDPPVIAGESVNSCNFSDQDQLNEAFIAWVENAQNQAIADLQGGCNTDISNNADQQILPDLCVGGDVTVTWTIADLCDTITVDVVFSITPPSSVSSASINDQIVDACDFSDQADVDAAFIAWVDTQTAAIDANGGCNPQITDNNNEQTIPKLCTGGSTIVTWIIQDLCDTITISAQFTLTAPQAITYNDPIDESIDACDLVDQSELDDAFTAWVNAQTAAFSVTGGCDPQITNNSDEQTIPELCTGGSTIVTWTINDLCDTITTTAVFNILQSDDELPEIVCPLLQPLCAVDDIPPYSTLQSFIEEGGYVHDICGLDSTSWRLVFEEINGEYPEAYLITRIYEIADRCGNINSCTQTILVPGEIVITLQQFPTTCAANNGTITVAVTGGTPGYTFAWTGPDGFTSDEENLTNLAAGEYTLTITDINGCTETASVTVESIETEINLSASLPTPYAPLIMALSTLPFRRNT
jgi:large repetitive protein